MQHPALLRPLAWPLAARCRHRLRGVRRRCAPAEGGGEEPAAAWLSSAVGEKVDELLLREENRPLLEGVEAAERRVELARAKLADLDRQEAAARLASDEVRRLERRRDEIAESQRELLKARKMIDEAQRSLTESLQDQSFGEVSSGDFDEDSERLESLKAAAVSSIIGVLASLPISLYEVHDFPQLFVRSSAILISCALFGVTFRYAIRRDVDNVQLKTGVAAAFAFVRGLSMVESGRSFELSTDALLSLALDGAVSVVENIFIFLPAAVALDYCFKIGSIEMALKVFNWLNRKMHPNVEYCTIDENKAMEKEDSVCESVTEQDTDALLLRDVLINGILAIGTLGQNINSLCPETCIEQEEFAIMGEEKLDEEKYEYEECAAKQDTFAAAPSELAFAAEPAKMHLSSMKEENFTCFVNEEILMRGMEVEDVAKIQEQPLLMLERVEKVRITLADLFAAEAFSSSDTWDKNCQNIIIGAEESTSKATLYMEKMHENKPTKLTPKPLKATRKLSRVMRKMLGKKIHPEQLNGRNNAEGPVTA